jgi:protein-S-isoprenylcysteine O-methyltransferase Ste14
MELKLKIPPVAQLLLVGAAMIASAEFLPRYNVNIILSAGLGSLLVTIGAYFSVFGVLEFKRNKTTVDPRFPDRSTSLVTTGVYSISRNPMYVGFAVFLCALVVYFRSPYLVLGVLVFVLYMNRFQIEPEEHVLEKHFGSDFVKYKSEVRRWL